MSIHTKARKTCEVSSLLQYANYQLARADKFATLEYKRGVCDMIEKILMDTGNYNGFMFLSIADSDLHTMGYWTRFYYRGKQTHYKVTERYRIKIKQLIKCRYSTVEKLKCILHTQ